MLLVTFLSRLPVAGPPIPGDEGSILLYDISYSLATPILIVNAAGIFLVLFASVGELRLVTCVELALDSGSANGSSNLA